MLVLGTDGHMYFSKTEYASSQSADARMRQPNAVTQKLEAMVIRSGR